jgi:pilus assembly protein TadC
MLASKVKADYKDFLALTIAFIKVLFPMIIAIILVLVLVSILLFH